MSYTYAVLWFSNNKKIQDPRVYLTTWPMLTSWVLPEQTSFVESSYGTVHLEKPAQFSDVNPTSCRSIGFFGSLRLFSRLDENFIIISENIALSRVTVQDLGPFWGLPKFDIGQAKGLGSQRGSWTARERGNQTFQRKTSKFQGTVMSRRQDEQR